MIKFICYGVINYQSPYVTSNMKNLHENKLTNNYTSEENLFVWLFFNL